METVAIITAIRAAVEIMQAVMRAQRRGQDGVAVSELDDIYERHVKGANQEWEEAE